MTTRHLLADYATILNKYGIGSHQEKKFLEANKDNKGLMELCETSRMLKEVLCPKLNQKPLDS